MGICKKNFKWNMFLLIYCLYKKKYNPKYFLLRIRFLTPVTRREVEFALKGMPLNKAPGPDNIFTEMLVASGEAGLTEHTSFTNMVYQKGCFPEKINNSIFITLLKVSGTQKCEKHRTISIMSHAIKLVLRVLMNRLRARSLMEISQVQYGFMPDQKCNICVM